MKYFPRNISLCHLRVRYAALWQEISEAIEPGVLVNKTFAIKLISLFSLAAVVMISLFFLVGKKNNGGFMGVGIISEEQADDVINGKEEHSSGEAGLNFNGSPAAYDAYENCYYVCQRLDSESWEGVLSAKEGWELLLIDDEMLKSKADAIEQAHEFRALSIAKDSFCSFRISFTALPTISFISEESDGDEKYGSVRVIDTTGDGDRLLTSFEGYARLHEKKKKDNIFSHINYGLHLLADDSYLRKIDADLFGLREDDDWELDSVMESRFAVDEMLAGKIWNSISREDGFSSFKLDMVYSYVFVDNRKIGLYIVRVPYDKKSLGLGSSDKLEEWDSVTEADLSEPDIDEFIDYSIFIETVYAPKNMVKNKYILRKDLGHGRKCYRLPRHLEYLFDNLPDNLTEYTLNVADSYEKYIVGDEAIKEISKTVPDITGLAADKWKKYRKNILSKEALTDALEQEINYLKEAGYYAKSSVEDPDALKSEREEYIAKRLEYLDIYFENDMEIPSGSSGISDVGVCFKENNSLFYISKESAILFAPSWFRGSELRFEIPEDIDLSLDGNKVKDGDIVDYEKLEGEPEIEITSYSESYKGKLKVMLSENVYSIYINTASGSMEYILSDISHKESGSVTVFKPDGTQDFKADFNTFKGHGRSSWVNDLEKKSYNLNFETAVSMADIGVTDKYCLIGNAYDGSFMRNHITYMLAENSSLKYTPGSQFTDLYINGEYCGLYLLSEKNIIGEDRVAIANLEEENAAANPGVDLKTQPTTQWSGRQGIEIENEPEDISGGYLIEGNLSHHAVTGFFNTQRDYRLEIDAPEYPSADETEFIYDYFQKTEDAIYSANGVNSDTGKRYDEYIDVVSFADKYLIDEISKNYDAVKYSAFYYKDKGDDALHAGPVWDYDIAYGNTNLEDYDINSPYGITNLLMGNRFKDNIFSELMKKDDFKREVAVRYAEVFEPQLKELLDAGIDMDAEKLMSAAAMDDKRYEAYKTEAGKFFAPSVDRLKEFIKIRKEVLDREFLR